MEIGGVKMDSKERLDVANQLDRIFSDVLVGLRKINVISLKEREDLEDIMQKIFDNRFDIKTGGIVIFTPPTQK